jgi:hypothetical protein
MKRYILEARRIKWEIDFDRKKDYSLYNKPKYPRPASHHSARELSRATKKEHRRARHQLNKVSLEVEE